MTNHEYYKSKHPDSIVDFRDDAMENFQRHCKKFDHCKGCPKYTGNLKDCFAAWLNEEHKDDEPMPCPFCNAEVKVYKGGYKDSNGNAVLSYVKCVKCGYTSPCNTEKDGYKNAVAEHNRIASIVAKESKAVTSAQTLIALLFRKLKHMYNPNNDLESRQLAEIEESVKNWEGMVAGLEDGDELNAASAGANDTPTNPLEAMERPKHDDSFHCVSANPPKD